MKAVTYIEIDVDYCSLTYSVAPCAAVLGVTGTQPCFNTRSTCQDRANFTNAPVTLRFAMPTDYLPADIEAFPNIAGVSYTPAIISLGEDLGQRASLSITFDDHPHSDTGPGFDKYLSERAYNPWDQGSFWGKFRTRQQFLRGRPLRWYQGLEGQALVDMDVRHFFVESFSGPGLDGKFTITATDGLKFADGDRAQAPLLSPGQLSAGITNIATAATLAPAGIGNSDYPASGYLNLGGKEIVAFTRVADALTLTRARFNTVGVAHDAAERVQLCLYHSAEDPADIIADLWGSYTDVPAGAIDVAAWEAETAAYYRRVLTALIPEPTPVRDLIAELVQQVGLAHWWDDRNEALRLQVLRAIDTTAQTYDDSNVVAGSLQVTEQPEQRLSRVWTYFGLINPLSGIGDTDNFSSSVESIDTEAEVDNGLPAIKTIFSRWIPFGGLTTAERVNDILLGRFRTAPRHFVLQVYRRGAEDPQGGQGAQLSSWPLQEADGSRSLVPIQFTRIEPRDDVTEAEADEMLFVSLDSDDLTTHTVTIDASFNNDGTRDLRSLHDNIFPEPVSGDDVVFNINAGVVIGATLTSIPAIDVGSWPASVNVTVNLYGRGQGKGGQGGHGDDGGSTNTDGLPGGVALYTRFGITLNYGVDAELWGGGGGGGGAAYGLLGGGPAGSGGAGTLPGLGGASGSTPGNPGTDTAGGAQTTGPDGTHGGKGGDPGMVGANASSGSKVGGAAGAAIDGLSYLTTSGSADVRGPTIN